MFKQDSADFNIFISPIAGNYGFNIGDVSFSVMYEDLKFENTQFARSFVHEYLHCYVNPVVESNVELLEAGKEFFKQHNNMLSFYNTTYAIINEYIVRAVVIKFLKCNPTMYSSQYIEEEILRQKKTFPFIEKFVLLIEQYEKSKLTFEEFYISSIEKWLMTDKFKKENVHE